MWFERGGVVSASTPARAPQPVIPTYPPQSELAELWSACQPVMGDSAVTGYLAFRGIDAKAVAAFDLARALPRAGALPDWARLGEKSWATTRHRLIVPLYDHRGVMRSVVARSVDRQPMYKSAGARGYARAGLVMADGLGRAMLERGTAPTQIVIREGEVDWASEAVAQRETNIAVLGIVSGSWTTAHAKRVPDGARVVIATDDDEQGDRYAAAIAATLDGRAQVERRRDAA